MKTLIIGYGNRSRNDDGVGWVVIERLVAPDLPDVTLETSHQLEIEVAETICAYDQVIFVDAAIPEAPQAVTRSFVQPHFQSHAVAHYLTPSDVLSLADTLYGHQPRAVLFSIRGHDFHFGETLSTATEAAAGNVVHQIVELVRSNQLPITSQPIAGNDTHA